MGDRLGTPGAVDFISFRCPIFQSRISKIHLKSFSHRCTHNKHVKHRKSPPPFPIHIYPYPYLISSYDIDIMRSSVNEWKGYHQFYHGNIQVKQTFIDFPLIRPCSKAGLTALPTALGTDLAIATAGSICRENSNGRLHLP